MTHIVCLVINRWTRLYIYQLSIALFLFNFFKVYHFYILKNCFTLCKIVLSIRRKIISFCHHNVMKKSRSKLSKNELVCMCKDGCCVGLRLKEGCLSKGGENCLKYLTKVWKRKDGRENKIFLKKRGKLCQWVCVLKKGSCIPLRNMAYHYWTCVLRTLIH